MSQQNDPLNEDLGSVSTDFPLIANGTIGDFIAEKVEIIEPSEAGKARALNIQWKSTMPHTSMTGEQLAPGAVVFDRCQLAPTGKGTMDMVKRNVASIVQAVPGLAALHPTLGNVDSWKNDIQGKIVRMTIIVEPASTNKQTGKQYPARNSVGLYHKAA